MSPVLGHTAGVIRLAPLQGKVGVGAGDGAAVGVFGLVGVGWVNTQDNLIALEKEDEPGARATQSQRHPSLELGLGLELHPSLWSSVELELRQVSYVETLASTTLLTMHRWLPTAQVSVRL